MLIWASSSTVEQYPLKVLVRGSNPLWLTANRLAKIMGQTGIPLGQWSGSDATEKQHKTIIEIDKSTNKKTNLIILLTVISIIVSLVGIVVTWIK